jgi:chromosomal replication initiation ATPase DnaA
MIQDYDERVLGNGEFIEQLRKVKEISDRLPAVLSLKELIVRIARAFEINPEDLTHRNRRREIVEIRSIISYFATREMGHNGAELGRALNISRSAVSIAANRGEEAVEKNPKLRKLIENN